MGFEAFGGCVTSSLSLFENLRFGTTKDQIFVCNFTLGSAVPKELQSFALGKAWKLSPPNRIEISLEWNSRLFPVHALHWFGIEIENAEVFYPC